MDYDALFADSAAYTRATLTGSWNIWIALIICFLPLTLAGLVLKSDGIFDGKNYHWDLVPWPLVIGLYILGFLLLFMYFGYVVRIYRGADTPPPLEDWGSLFVDGIRLAVVTILWYIPGLVALAAGLIFIAIGVRSDIPPSLTMPLLSAGFILLILGVIFLLVGELLGNLGVVRMAREGSIREGIRMNAILSTLQGIGWGNYLFLMVILGVLCLVYYLVLILLGLVPVVGWVFPPLLAPVAGVFLARYLSRVYDHGVPAAPVPAF